MINLTELNRYHLFIDSCYYPDQKFLGDFESFEAAGAFIKKRYEAKEASSKQAYAIVTMGDMSPAALSASQGEDPEDICVEFIGNYTQAEYESMKEELEKIEADAKAEYGNDVRLGTIYSEDDEVGIDVEDYGLWDNKLMCWFSCNDLYFIGGRDNNVKWSKSGGSGFEAEDYKAA